MANNSEPDQVKTDSRKFGKDERTDHRHAWVDAIQLVDIYRSQFSAQLVQNITGI